MPLVSVIMPVYNGEKYLPEAIDSILTQTFTDFELLIVDDGSQDGSADIIRSYAEADNCIHFLQHEENLGQAQALNTGIAAAAGELITMMDCDDVSLPERLEKQVAFLEAHPNIGGVGTRRKVFNHDLSTLKWCTQLPEQHALIALNWFIASNTLGATLMLRREYLLEVGGYESGRLAVQDLEFESRLFHQTSIRFAGLPEHLYIHRQHKGGKQKGPGTFVFEEYTKLVQRVLIRLWNEAPETSLGSLHKLRLGTKMSWRERRATKRDLKRLIQSLIDHNWVEQDDESLLIAAMNRRLEKASPRRWQQFCHWRRHRLGL